MSKEQCKACSQKHHLRSTCLGQGGLRRSRAGLLTGCWRSRSSAAVGLIPRELRDQSLRAAFTSFRLTMIPPIGSTKSLHFALCTISGHKEVQEQARVVVSIWLFFLAFAVGTASLRSFGVSRIILDTSVHFAWLCSLDQRVAHLHSDWLLVSNPTRGSVSCRLPVGFFLSGDV